MKTLMDYRFIIPLVLFLGFAPFFPQPHIIEKIRLVAAGSLSRPIDIFDLFLHAWPFALLSIRIARDFNKRVS